MRPTFRKSPPALSRMNQLFKLFRVSDITHSQYNIYVNDILKRRFKKVSAHGAWMSKEEEKKAVEITDGVLPFTCCLTKTLLLTY